MTKMKDSGIEWIGEIPDTWKITKLKYEVKDPLKYGASESGVEYDADGWDEGDPGAFAYFYDDSYETTGLMVEVGTYAEGDDIVIQFCVYVDSENN